jgi:hypothetical protein
VLKEEIKGNGTKKKIQKGNPFFSLCQFFSSSKSMSLIYDIFGSLMVFYFLSKKQDGR